MLHQCKKNSLHIIIKINNEAKFVERNFLTFCIHMFSPYIIETEYLLNMLDKKETVILINRTASAETEAYVEAK